MQKLGVIVAVIAAATIIGCGGGGGGTTTVAPSTPPPVLTPIAVSGYSLVNGKPDIEPINLTAMYAQQSAYGDYAKTGSFFIANTYADFNQDGRLDVFIASQMYDPAKHTMANAPKGHFEFFTQDASGTYKANSSLATSDVGCLHPRKAIVADFNRDSKPDIFVACHGYDADPFPGEASYILLSNTSGKYTSAEVSGAAGFMHAASAADIDKNGTIDLLLVDSKNGYRLMLNDGAGNFTTKLLPAAMSEVKKRYYTGELYDFNGDGNVDVLLAGHEPEHSPSRIWYGNGTSDFGSATDVQLPAAVAANATGIVLDVVPVDISGDGKLDLILGRTSFSPFYQTQAFQVLTNTGTGYSVSKEWSRPASGNTAWVPWIRYRNGNVISDNQFYQLSQPAK